MTTNKIVMNMFEYIEQHTTKPQQFAIGTTSVVMLTYLIFWVKNRIPINTSKKEQLNIIIIGASRGIGLSLARNFLIFGDNVIIASSSETSIKNAHNTLSSEFDLKFPNQQILGSQKCDITQKEDLQNLFEYASETFNNQIDIVINNAGIGGKERDYLWNIASDEINKILLTNLGGIILSNQMTIKHYLKTSQLTPIHIFNQSGAGTNGMSTPRFLCYGASKGGLLNVMNSLNKELKLAQLNGNIFIHTLSPGMVWTNLIAKKSLIENKKPVISDKKSYWIINALTADCQTCTQWLVPRMRGIATKHPAKSGYFPQYLTRWNAMMKIFGAALFGYNKEKYVDKNGMAVKAVK